MNIQRLPSLAIMIILLLPQALLGESAPAGLPLDENGNEKYLAGWNLHIDNDLLVPGAGYDQDYTGGLGLTLAGKITTEHWWSLDPLLHRVDKLSGVAKLAGTHSHTMHAAQFGLIVFTPSDIGRQDAIYDDRPFANLLYLSNSRRTINQSDQAVYQSTLTLGLLGTGAGTEIQKGIHNLIGSKTPNGWDHQISEGGEPTMQYSLHRQSLLSSNFQLPKAGYEIKYGLNASVGYISEVSISITGRWGIINTPWWSFTPENGDYNYQPAPIIGNAVRENTTELYLWGGIKARARGYNAFLQGQFRQSDVTFATDELNHLIAEAWVGITGQVKNYRLSYVLRYQTKEIKNGEGARNPIWGGLIFSVDF